MSSSRGSPLSDVPSESGFTTLSLRDKSLMKRSINKHHNNNFRAGYVPVNEQALRKTGIRGRKTYAFWTLVVLLFCLALGNLILTIIILGVLRLGQGMESLELVPENNLIMFFGNTDLDRIYKRDGKLEGFDEAPVEIVGDNAPVTINLQDHNNKWKDQKLFMNARNISISGIDTFQIRDPRSGKIVFSTEFPNFGLPSGVQQLDVNLAQTGRISSPINSILHVQADTKALLKGNEGTRMEGREIVWSAEHDIILRSENGSLILGGREGLSLDVQLLPLTKGLLTSDITHYKLCVCMPGGKLFKVPITSSTHKQSCPKTTDLSLNHNPCM